MRLQAGVFIVIIFGLLSLTATLQAQAPIKEIYTKIERHIPMRDGVELFTSIYIPKTAVNPIRLSLPARHIAASPMEKIPSLITWVILFLLQSITS
jgi:predicted acyl esterase